MADKDGSKSVFASCQFAFVPSRSLLPKTIAELSRTVEKYGGVALDPESDGRLPLDKATHIVANSIDFEQYSQAIEMMLPVVTVAWITHSLSRGKLAQIRPFSPDPRMIFSSVNLTCADIPQCDKEAITGATMALGGMESKDLTRLTTHICALSMDHPKCKEAEAKNLRCKIVLPHWFDDCFKLGKKIDEGPYLLPDPPILRGRRVGGGDGGDGGDDTDSIPIPDNQDLDGAVSAVPESIPTLERQGWRSNLTVFQNKKVMLSTDLNVGRRFRAIVVDLIRRGGGRVVEEDDSDGVEACDMFICQYRDGEEYVRAAQAGKDVGNLAWLFHIITNNEWCSPLRRLLHYPVPRHGIPGFEDYVITLSNYGGEARIYLENLVVAAGARFTKTMRMDNTHLITARDNSEKCEAARDWSIQMVNHLWIEESYARCEVQSVTSPRYTTFPARTNLGEVIGQTFLDASRLRAQFYPGGADAEQKDGSSQVPAAAAANSKGGSNRNKSGNETGDENENDEETASEASGAEEETTATAATTAKTVTMPRRPARQAATPKRASRKAGRQDKETEGTPLVMSSASRSAKDKALSKLHGLASDIALYEKEKKRGGRDGHGPWGGKRAADQVDKDRLQAPQGSKPKKRTSADVEDEMGSDSSSRGSEAERPTKKSRPSLPPVTMRVVLTGYQRWVHSSSKEEADRRKLRGLGIQIVQDSQPCDYLAAPCLVRTMKFLKTLARGPTVINSQYITDVLESGRLLAADKYALEDVEGEERFQVTLSRALGRARANRGRLLWNVVVYCMADIKNGSTSYREIAEANGAIFKTYRAHSGTTIRPVDPKTTGGEADDGPTEPVYLLTSAAPTERALWPKFEQMARDGRMEPRVVAPDWLLDVAMRQEVVFDEHYLARRFFV
ncbi:brct domain containing protein [Grosmannia clavigera kw1407]|uniref:Brct domain containing protein n=1 Tax=Grosmannia clavigera (strain kw1407 / UAMH 11150) TaxID=655863 RepID=F0XFY3_GROCL|nr:brct domain containing protein [Grosmannia clavigera kw1407]EFX03377.1 brct domain containing protein [Grosmannia clavigera kw1407]